MKPEPERETVIRKAECPNGHRINLHIVANTPNLIQMVTCPVCGVKRVGLIPQLIAVTRADSD